MCLLVVAHRVSEKAPLLVAANRDEFMDRPTVALHRWEDDSGIVGGRDLEAGGTWLGVRSGRWAALTNVRQLPAPKKNGPSRGQLVVKALTLNGPVTRVAAELQAEADQYQGFNLIVGDATHLCYVSNYTDDWRELSPGIYPLSNGTLDSAWPKMASAHARMARFTEQPGSAEDLSGLLASEQKADDGALPDTGVAPELEKALSSEFIVLPDYGTRSATGLIIDRNGRLEMVERSYTRGGELTGIESVEEPGFW